MNIPTGYSMRSPTMADLDAVQRLIAAVDLAEVGESDADNDDLRLDWEKADLARDAWLVHAPDGQLVSYALVTDRAHVQVTADVYLHPDHYGRGIGTAINRRTEERAAQHLALAPVDARVTLGTYINAPNERAAALLANEGYTLLRHFWRMGITLDEAPAAPRWPAGLTTRPFDPAWDAPAVYAAITESFGDMWGYIPPEYPYWHGFMIERDDFEPALWTVVEDGDQIAAVACAYRFADHGHLRSLAVRRPWRRRGLALALLQHTFGLFWARGERSIALGVDAESLTGATRLYQRAGMQIVRQFALWEKELRSGVDLSTQQLAE
ncbi:MAG TPA: GNAT family N-acetyltransferase [Thermomicrobiales bacterium]